MNTSVGRQAERSEAEFDGLVFPERIVPLDQRDLPVAFPLERVPADEFVIPAKAGTQCLPGWVPAFAGMTKELVATTV